MILAMTSSLSATTQDTTKDPAAKAAAVALLSRGLATRAEVARLAGVSRQLAKHWAKDIPAERARDSVLAKLWRSEIARK
jgi:transposase-like protein